MPKKINDVEKKSCIISLGISQIDYEKLIIKCNKNKILINDYIRNLIYKDLKIKPYKKPVESYIPISFNKNDWCNSFDTIEL